VIPSGLSTTADYETTYATADRIVAEFANDLGANTVRLPVNPYSVGTDWWSSYKAAIDAATHRHFKVILSYWEGSDAQKDGRVDDPAAWSAMWDTLTTTYRRKARVYFEPMNEPFGYAPDEWVSVATAFVDRYTARGIPRNRIFVSGVGYNDHVAPVCAVPALAGTYVSQHYYGFWGTHTYPGWVEDFTSRLGDQTCSDRTVLDEFGVPMTTGIDYSAPWTGSDPATNNSVAFLQAVTDTIRARHMGSVYWPGLRTGDTYSLETLDGTGADLSLTVNNWSGVSLLEWGWGRPPHPPA
jgi:endoglucanase